MRTDLRLRSFDLCVRAILFGAALLPITLSAADAPAVIAEEQAQAPSAQVPASAPPATPAPAPQIDPSKPQRPPVLPKGQKPAVPDYPDPRTLTIGAYYWGTLPGTGPDLVGGRFTRDFGTIRNLGKTNMGPGVFASIAISRASEIRFEGFSIKGAGNQKLAAGKDPFVFGTQFNGGDYLSNSYKILSGKIWIDDLLWPHKFPVEKFRVKAIYGARYLAVKGVVDAPLKLLTGSTLAGVTALGNKQVILPMLGIAPEYAISKHVLFRVEGSGFGLPKKSALWDAEATLSWRRRTLEIFGGFKAVGFKTSPKEDYFYSGQAYGGVFGIKYHWQ